MGSKVLMAKAAKMAFIEIINGVSDLKTLKVEPKLCYDEQKVCHDQPMYKKPKIHLPISTNLEQMKKLGQLCKQWEIKKDG